jgi:hypothetical protein
VIQVTPGSEGGWVKVKLTSAGTGWLGFGVAQQGESERIMNAQPAVTQLAAMYLA